MNNLVPALDEFVIFRYIIFILLRKKLKLGPDDHPPLLTMAYSLVILFRICCLTYIVERESCLVDPRAHKFVNPKLFHVFPYLILDPREDEVNNAASGGRVEEGVFVTDIKVIHPVLLKWGSEKLLLWLDNTFIHLEDFGKPVEITEG